MMSASTATSISGQYTGAPVALATGATAPMWSKWQWVTRIASMTTPSAPAAASSLSASSPGSTITARPSPPAARTMYACSWIGPTVNIRTSRPLPLGPFAPRRPPAATAHPSVLPMAASVALASWRRRLPSVSLGLGTHAPLVQPGVRVVADRHIGQQHDREQRERLARLPGQQQHRRQQQNRRRQRAPERPPPGRHAILAREAALLRLCLLPARDALLRGGRLAPRTPARLDHSRGVAAVLGLTSAPGLGHDFLETLHRRPLQRRSSLEGERPEA